MSGSVGERLLVLGRIGADPGGGVTRLALTPEEREATNLVATWMEAAGMSWRVDHVGNLIGTYAGTETGLAPVATGSHLDTVKNGGMFDGSLGVLGAIECIGRFHRHGVRFPRDIHVIAFVGEEPSRFPGLLGSAAIRGILPDPEHIHGLDGTTLADALRLNGLDPASVGDSRWNDPVHAFVELHIEQGRVLEEAAIPVGVVTGIAGLRIYECTVRGRADHAGTTPMALRHDAFAGVAEMTLAIERMVEDVSPTAVSTVGRVCLRPNQNNVIPGEATFSVDLRDINAQALHELEDMFQETFEEIANRRKLNIQMQCLLASDPTSTHVRLTKLIRETCLRQDVPYMELPSGAGHDAQNMAVLGPIAMIFVRTRCGISHSPDEFIEATDLEQGVNVLEGTLRALAADREGIWGVESLRLRGGANDGSRGSAQ